MTPLRRRLAATQGVIGQAQQHYTDGDLVGARMLLDSSIRALSEVATELTDQINRRKDSRP